MKTVYVSIDHDESDQLSAYKGVIIDIDNKKKVFYSGDPVKDWKEAVEYTRKQKPDFAMMSSSVDHFVMDVPGLGWDDNDMIVYVNDKN